MSDRLEPIINLMGADMDNQDSVELSPEARGASHETSKICPHCGESLSIAAAVCPSCQTPLGDRMPNGYAVWGGKPKAHSKATLPLIAAGVLGGLIALLLVVNRVKDHYEHQEIEAEGCRRMEMAAEGRRRAAEAEAKKTPEQRAAEQAAVIAIRDKGRAEAEKAAKARKQCEELFSDLRMAMARSFLVASEMVEQNTLNSYFRKRDHELAQSLQASRQETTRIARIYAGLSPTLQDSILGEAIYNALEYCEYSAKAAKAWMAYLQTLDAEDRDQAKFSIRQAHQAENDFRAKSEKFLQALP